MLLTLLLICPLPLALLYIIYYPPRSFFDYMQYHHPSVLFHLPLPSDQKIVALTIDDAPSSYTSSLLDLLRTYTATATFFIIGDQVTPLLAPLLQRMVEEGHEVGNHTWTDEKSVLRSIPELQSQIRRVDAILPKNPSGYKWFRPGGGFFSSKMVEAVSAMGYKMVLGCIYPHDPQVWSPELNAKHVLGMVREGGIIILHDRRTWSVKQLELILLGLKDRGWKVVSLGELLNTWEEVEGKKVD